MPSPWNAIVKVWRGVRTPLVRRILSICFALIALFLIYRQLSNIALSDFLAALASTSGWAVLASIALTLGSYACLSGTEWLALAALGRPLRYRQAALVAAPSYALTNSAGFSPATGTMIRIRLYARHGLSAAESARVAMLAGACVTLSGVVAGGVALLARSGVYARVLHAPRLLLDLGGVIFLLPALLWFLAFTPKVPAWLGRPTSRALGLRERLVGLGAGLGDWFFSCAALFALFPNAHWGVFPGFLGVYVASSILSAATGVPGGAGVFEAAMLMLTSIVARAHETAAALVLYRCLYSLGPLAIAAAFGLTRRALPPRG
jgi:phosphatidylglycerol lysyltransferase